jgi:hypothetical protein
VKRLGIAIFVIAIISLAICLRPGTPSNSKYIYEDGAILVGADGEPIELINNSSATNPTYAELVAFIVANSVDTNTYFEGGPKAYVCSDFAEDVHNDAEAAGIRAAWVSIDLQGEDEGHALNAFETSDRGLVYIDCTGERHGFVFIPQINKYLRLNPDIFPEPKPESNDTIAYLEIGREYGRIDLAYATSLSYGFYEEYKWKWQNYERLLNDYNDEVARYNQEISGKIYYEGTPELASIEAWEATLRQQEQELDELKSELGDFRFEPLGIVEDINIYWGNS